MSHVCFYDPPGNYFSIWRAIGRLTGFIELSFLLLVNIVGCFPIWRAIGRLTGLITLSLLLLVNNVGCFLIWRAIGRLTGLITLSLLLLVNIVEYSGMMCHRTVIWLTCHISDVIGLDWFNHDISDVIEYCAKGTSYLNIQLYWPIAGEITRLNQSNVQ